jgi:hypothetical protein
VRVIYIAIPLFIIPQLMLGGTIVHFGKLNPNLASWRTPAWIGNAMVSRWSFEALAAELASQNARDKTLFEWDSKMAEAEYRRDRWHPEMKRQLETGDDIRLISKELQRLENRTGLGLNVDASDGLDAAEILAVKQLLDVSLARERSNWLEAKTGRDMALQQLGWGDPVKAADAARNFHNNELERWVTGVQVLGALNKGWVQEDNRLTNTRDALYQTGEWKGADRPYYSAYKTIGGENGLRVSTLWYNLAVLWSVAALCFVALRLNWPEKITRWAPLR